MTVKKEALLHVMVVLNYFDLLLFFLFWGGGVSDSESKVIKFLIVFEWASFLLLLLLLLLSLHCLLFLSSFSRQLFFLWLVFSCWFCF